MFACIYMYTCIYCAFCIVHCLMGLGGDVYVAWGFLCLGVLILVFFCLTEGIVV